MTLTSGAPTAESPTAEPLTEDNAANPAAEASTAAASSTADEKDAKPVDLLSVVKNAVVEKDEDDETAPSAVVGEGEAKPGEAEAKPAEGATDAEAQAEADAKLPFHKHPRWQEVIAERDSFRDDAGRFRQMEGYMQQHGLQPEEVAEGFDVMAKLKSGDPQQLTDVREYFSTRLKALDSMLGFELPDDLRERVDNGELAEDAAQELAQRRAADTIRTTTAEARQTAEVQEREQRAVANVATAMATAVDEWERQQKAGDPDYAKKADLVETTCRAIVQRTGRTPTTPEEAVQLVKDAHAEVTKHFKSLQPPPKAIRPSPIGSSAPTVTEPKTLREAITSSLGR